MRTVSGLHYFMLAESRSRSVLNLRPFLLVLGLMASAATALSAQGATEDPRRLQLSRITLVDAPAFAPRWSADGRSLLYERRIPGGMGTRWQLWQADVPGPSKRLLIVDGSDGTWSLHGRRIDYIRHSSASDIVES